MAVAGRNPRNTGLGLMDRYGCRGRSLRVGIPIPGKLKSSCVSQLFGVAAQGHAEATSNLEGWPDSKAIAERRINLQKLADPFIGRTFTGKPVSAAHGKRHVSDRYEKL